MAQSRLTTDGASDIAALMTLMDQETRSTLKTQLFRQIAALGRQNALLPSAAGAIDQLIMQLEQGNPTPHPLHSAAMPQLLGAWELIYASRGTVVTRRLAPFSPGFGATGVTIHSVWQTLTFHAPKTLNAENGAELEIPFLGRWRLRADGQWGWEEEREQEATVKFNAFAIQARQAFGQPQWQLPELKIPVLEFLQNEAWWRTSYLDEDLRVGRGKTGNLFVFRKSIM
ncbi:PAP/fibrillin family protein [Egbenema bharatensis]|uniref:PAP/fibrillin family protein n=1 Tax=Egbenema bharatensis TaxID=3463334 RepID=UPI003A87B0CF